MNGLRRGLRYPSASILVIAVSDILFAISWLKDNLVFKEDGRAYRRSKQRKSSKRRR